jgi:hypothetical protein
MAESTELTQEELEAERAEQLPEREAMSIVDLGDPGTLTAAPMPTDSAGLDDAEGIPTREIHNPSEPPF